MPAIMYVTEALFCCCLDSPRATSPFRTEIRVFESKTLVCQAFANPAPISNDYKWYNPDGHINSSTSELTFTRTTRMDAGNYTCHVRVRSNTYGSLIGTSNTIVTVLCK